MVTPICMSLSYHIVLTCVTLVSAYISYLTSLPYLTWVLKFKTESYVVSYITLVPRRARSLRVYWLDQRATSHKRQASFISVISSTSPSFLFFLSSSFSSSAFFSSFLFLYSLPPSKQTQLLNFHELIVHGISTLSGDSTLQQYHLSPSRPSPPIPDANTYCVTQKGLNPRRRPSICDFIQYSSVSLTRSRT